MFIDEYENNNTNKIYISLGNYCLTSMLLKENNLKYESYPFDWMVSCIDNIINIFEDNFNEFLNKNNYYGINNQTRNNYYINNTKKIFNNIEFDHQHHNLLEINDYNYLKRCVERLNNVHHKYEKIIFIMIQPLYLNNLSIDKLNIIKLYDILYNKYGNKIKLCIFNIINENNNIYKEEYLNQNLVIIELDTKMICGKYGMMYFDNNGINKFLKIINEIF
jgi:hypothetical protein